MNILLVKLSAIGDIIHALPVSYAIKKLYPNCHLTWVTEPLGETIIRHNPFVDEIIVFEKKKFKSDNFLSELKKLKNKLNQRKYDLSIDLQGLFKSAAIVYLADAKQKIGYCNLREGSNLISKKIISTHAQGHIVNRYLDTLSFIDKSKSYFNDVEFPFVPNLEDNLYIENLISNIQNKLILLAIGTNWTNKTWTDIGYKNVIEYFIDRSYQPIIIGNGKNDEEKANRVYDLVCEDKRKKLINFVGKTSLSQLAVLIKKSSLVIGGDTGSLHLASGLKIPVIMLMGPTDANRNGPYNQLENAITVDRDCIHCWNRKCKFNYDCLSLIDSNEVIEKAKSILKSK